MSRDKQIEEMAKTMCFQANSCNVKSCVQVNCEKTWLAEALYNAGYRKESEWVSVEDRLPQPFVSVLVYMPGEVPHPTVREGFINKRGEWYAGGFDRLPDEVAAWKEMPDPPKMKGSDDEQR